MTGLHPDVMLGVKLSATIARGKYDDPEPTIEELYRLAGDRTDILAKETGTWAGWHDGERDTQRMVDALKTIPGIVPWYKVGQQRRNAPRHGTHDYPQRS